MFYGLTGKTPSPPSGPVLRRDAGVPVQPCGGPGGGPHQRQEHRHARLQGRQEPRGRAQRLGVLAPGESISVSVLSDPDTDPAF